ncbi:LemA family protein [Desulfocurvus vexinensis]|uniref:LemA family protein n=1 Tax=Desulfocurvus vexinensis TaxID=399548 RepID=UPI0004AF260A|nr:LemA family protein [Desulfocurvus vexinensis]
MNALFAFAATLLAIGLCAALIHGRLAALRRLCLAALGRADAALRRRHDLVVALVEAGRSQLPQAGDALADLALAREAASAAAAQAAARGEPLALHELGRAEERLETLLTRLRTLARAAREQDTAASLGPLFQDLDDAAHHVALARLAYNEAARGYNAYRHGFPALLLAGAFGFEDAPFLEFGGALFRVPPGPGCTRGCPD